MSNEEFSNAFTTLLNSYNTQAQFGEQASHSEIVLDEYEKSVFLTQAQDMIVKSYYDRHLNPQGQGMDDSTRRQIDFSSLIKVVDLTAFNQSGGGTTTTIIPQVSEIEVTVDNISIGSFTFTNKTANQIDIDILYYSNQGSYKVNNTNNTVQMSYSNETLTIKMYPYDSAVHGYGYMYYFQQYAANHPSLFNTSNYSITNITVNGYNDGDSYDTVGQSGTTYSEVEFTAAEGTSQTTTSAIISSTAFDYTRGRTYKLPTKTVNGVETTDVLFIINEKMIDTSTKREYVIKPISHEEYDREMSKPFGQPLKRQAWRLLQNASSGFNLLTELIPQYSLRNSLNLIYRIRYIRRPRPIILEDMPSSDLEIDGYTTKTTCELNPSVHMDILQKAVELAIATRGTRQSAQNSQQ